MAGNMMSREQLTLGQTAPFQTGAVPRNQDFQDLLFSIFHVGDDTAERIAVDAVTHALWESLYGSGSLQLDDYGRAILTGLLNLLVNDYKSFVASLADGSGSQQVGYRAAGSAVVRNVLEILRERCSLRDYGATGNGTTDDLAAFVAARAELGALGKIELRGGSASKYYFSPSRPDLTGIVIDADPDAILKVDAHPDVKLMNILRPLTVENPVHQTTRRFPANTDLPMDLLRAAAGTAALDDLIPAVLYANTLVHSSISGRATQTAGSGTVTQTQVTWPGGFLSDQQGLVWMPGDGYYYAVTFENSGGSGIGGDTVSIAVIGSTRRVDFAVVAGAATWRVIEHDNGMIETGTTPNGGAYSLSPSGGSVSLGVQIAGNKLFFYINNYPITSYVIAGEVESAAALVSHGISSTVTLYAPFEYEHAWLPAPRTLSVGVIGDSIMRGAWSSLCVEHYLQIFCAGMRGVGKVNVDNLAISGTSTGQWASTIGTYNLSGYDVVLIMLGTNDVQGGVAVSTVAANINVILDAVEAAGAVPVLGVFPVWTQASVSGVVGVSTSNYARGAAIRAMIRRLAAARNLQIADVEAHFGDMGEYGDNIHPNEYGQAVVAKAFASALQRQFGRRTMRYGWKRAILLNGWTRYNSLHPFPQFGVRDGIVRLKGSITGGAAGSAIFVLPSGYRPAALRRRFPVAALNGSAVTHGEVVVDEFGQVLYSGGPTTLVALDGITFDVV